MKFTIVLLVVVTLAIRQYSAEDSKEEKAGKGKSVEARTRLFKALFENYNPEVIPDSVNLKFGAALITTKFFEEESTLDTNLWLRMVWKDQRLTWDEKEFGGISVLRVSPSNVWIPDLRLYNAADTRHGDTSTSSCDNTKVLIYPNGEVLWVPPCRYFSRCAHTLLENPNAQQTCTLKFGSWTYDGLTMDINMYNNENSMDLSDFDDITEWKVLSAPAERTSKKYDCCEEPYIDIKFNITLQRKPRATLVVE